MRIAQVAPPIERVPPHLYGGTERVVSFLTEQLVADGHEVTLFASGDSITAAELVPCSETALRLDPNVEDYTPHLVVQLDRVLREADRFDVIHFHTDLLHHAATRALGRKAVTTLHGRLDFPDCAPFFRHFRESQLVSISDAQRRPLPDLNYLATIHHGLPADLFRFNPAPRGDYAVFLGRICPEKAPDRAIAIAARLGMPLRVAAKVDRVDRAYWEERIRPMIEAHPNVDYIGEVDEAGKQALLQDALVLLNPIEMPEPFGLVMIEGMACGTPSVSYRRGSVEEVVEHGVSGMVVDSIEAAVAAVPAALALDRAAVRAAFDRRFTAARMAADYGALYRRLAAP